MSVLLRGVARGQGFSQATPATFTEKKGKLNQKNILAFQYSLPTSNIIYPAHFKTESTRKLSTLIISGQKPCVRII